MNGEVDRLLAAPRRSKRSRWADYYLVALPPTIFESPEHEAEYFRIRRELQAEINSYGSVRDEAPEGKP